MNYSESRMNTKSKFFYKDGTSSGELDYSKVIHRTDGPAADPFNGTKVWCTDGRLHRTDGPAMEWVNGTKEWWVDNKRHRVDGPAIEYADGDKYWWVDDIQYSEKQFEALIEEIRNLPKALKLTDPREWVRKVG